MKTYRLTVLPGGRTISAAEGSGLADLLKDAGIPLSLYCRQRGVCGKCAVEIVRGQAGIMNPAEAAQIANRRFPPGFRLACQVRIQGPLTVRIPRESLAAAVLALTEGFRRDVGVEPAMRKWFLPLSGGTVLDSRTSTVAGGGPSAGNSLKFSAGALRILKKIRSESDAPLTLVVFRDDEVVTVEPGDTSQRLFGAAIDLGTTTVAAELVDLNTGATVASAAGLNGQSRFGADVVSRITAAHLDPSLRAGLRAAALRTIDALLAELARAKGIPAESIYEAVIAGNTVMNHLFIGLPVDTLAAAPFEALFTTIEPLTGESSGLRAINADGRVTFAPNIGSFVGGDIAAGLTAVDIENGPGRILFIDLGTNGELVLKNGAALSAASTAAGPAFEGTNLSCGMIAAPGAVQRAEFAGGTFVVQVIGGGNPIGLCGSGLIDVLAEALAQGTITADGVIRNSEKMIEVAAGVRLTQKDVREVQLAAAAIKTGMRMLMAEEKMNVGDLDRILIAGAFGSTLDIGRAVSLGLIPAADPARIEFVGNVSLTGAKMLLISETERKRCERLAAKVRHRSLAESREFQRIFVESLKFEKWKSIQ